MISITDSPCGPIIARNAGFVVVPACVDPLEGDGNPPLSCVSTLSRRLQSYIRSITVWYAGIGTRIEAKAALALAEEQRRMLEEWRRGLRKLAATHAWRTRPTAGSGQRCAKKVLLSSTPAMSTPLW